MDVFSHSLVFWFEKSRSEITRPLGFLEKRFSFWALKACLGCFEEFCEVLCGGLKKLFCKRLCSGFLGCAELGPLRIGFKRPICGFTGKSLR